MLKVLNKKNAHKAEHLYKVILKNVGLYDFFKDYFFSPVFLLHGRKMRSAEAELQDT